MTSRVTRNNHCVAENNENNILVTKNSNIPVPSKRKAEDELKKESKTRKRAAFGDLTNALSDKPSNGATNIKNQVKKGLNNFVGKGKTSIKAKDSKIASKKVVGKAEGVEVKNPEQSTSSSSEEGLLCILDTSDTSNDVTVKEEEKLEPKVYEIKEEARKVPPKGVLDFDLETFGDPQQHSEYAMETFQYYKVEHFI